MTNNDELQTCITAVQAKQCCVIDELRIAIVLVAKVRMLVYVYPISDTLGSHFGPSNWRN